MPLPPSTINRIRSNLLSAYNRARKAGIWTGPNPIADVETQKVPKQIYLTLTAEEVPLMLACVPQDWVGFMAVGVYLGLRKGEAAGLRKTNVDLKRELLTIQASYDNATTKGKRTDILPIPPPLLPFVKAGLKTPGLYLFPAVDGSMRKPESDPEKILRFALGRAGIVDGYDHVCRRCKSKHGKEYTWRHTDKAPRNCPTCNMRLWVHAIPRGLRFHDLRHSTATVLSRAGVDIHRVQRILRHASITTTIGTYTHLMAEDLREAISNPWRDSTWAEPDLEPKAMVAGTSENATFNFVAPNPSQITSNRGMPDIDHPRNFSAMLGKIDGRHAQFRTADPYRVKVVLYR